MTEAWKYFAYKAGNYWRCNELISVTQIRAMLEALEWKHEVFASIQTYDENENIVGGPLWFDLDGEPDRVLEDARGFVNACEFLVNCAPRIYFSGSKGFHFIIERFIEHPRVHELALDFAKEVGTPFRTIDHKVYRTRSMFRIPGSPASRPGFYKIELTRNELMTLPMEEIRGLARTQRFIATEHDPSKLDEELIDKWFTAATAQLPDLSTLAKARQVVGSINMEMTPCIATMLTQEPAAGERNATVYVLAKFFRSCEIDEDNCRKILLERPHFAAFEAEGREITKVLRSVYRSQRPSSVGCRGTTQYAALMRSYCAAPCHFRPDFDHNPWSETKDHWDVE